MKRVNGLTYENILRATKSIFRTSENILGTSEEMWEPIIVCLVQFEKDSNTHTTILYGRMDGWVGWLPETRLIPRLSDGDDNGRWRALVTLIP